MITTIQTCDRCNAEVETLFELSLQIKTLDSRIFSNSISAIAPVQWCRECCIATGYVKWTPIPTPPPPTPTLEDFLRDFINETVDSRS